jgi:hypothetical protein
MNPRLALRFAVAGLVILLACLWCFSSCCAAASSDAFRERFNLPEDPEPLLQRILSAREFKEQPIQTLLERLEELTKELLLRSLEWLLEKIPSAGPFRVPERSMWYVVAALILGGLLVFVLILAFRVLFSGSGRTPVNSRQTDLNIEDAEPLSSRDSWDPATRTAEQADYSEAIVYLFRFVVSWLDEQGQLAFHPSKTNRELLAGLGENAPPREALAEMIPVFDGVKYGVIQCGQTEYERFLALSRRITRQS